MKKLLIVEDDEFLVNAYSVKLKALEDFEMIVARDGREALEIISTSEPDLIILDLVMPNMDGYTFLEEFKKMQFSKKIPIIVASNLDSGIDIEKARALGASDYLIKSETSINAILEKVKSYG